MKNVFVIFSLIFAFIPQSLFAAQCTDFSGDYAWSDGDGGYLGLEVTQENCERVVMRYELSGIIVKHTHILDGKRRLVEDNGDFQAYETAQFVSPTEMSINEERFATDEDGDPYQYSVEMTVFLNPDGDLVTVRRTINENGAEVDKSKYTYKRRSP